MQPLLSIPINGETDILIVRQRAKELALLCGLSTQDNTRFVTALSEIIRNALQYAGSGTAEFGLLPNEVGVICLAVRVTDHGPGIAKLDEIMRGSHISATGMGKGLTGCRKLVDLFSVDSTISSGTSVILGKALPSKSAGESEIAVGQWLKTLEKQAPPSAIEALQQQNKQLAATLTELEVSKKETDEQLVRINQLNEELGLKSSQLELKNTELNETLSELQKSKKHLEQVGNELREATSLKSEFLANMSHEIRTPMNAIIGIGDILSRSPLDDRQLHMVTLLRDAGRSLLSLVNDILDISKIEAGKLVLESTKFDLVKTVEGAAELLRTQASEKKLSLTTFISPEIPKSLDGDPSRLRQILINLVGNGLKFTSSGGVTVRVIPEAQNDGHLNVRFSVTDTGMGITQAKRDLLFQAFVQLDGSTNRKHGGSGLGLSISKRLVQLMGGEIGLESESGKGCTFWFTLPFESAVTIEPDPELAGLSSAERRVLVVADDLAERENLRLYLDSWHVGCQFASTTQEALSILQKQAEGGQPCPVALIDAALPMNMTGVQLGAELRQNPKLAGTKLILMYGHEDDISPAKLPQGLIACVSKPIKQYELFAALRAGLCKSVTEPKVPVEASMPAQTLGSSTRLGISGDWRILLVEDNHVNQIVVLTELEELGLNADLANDGNEALQAVTMTNYDLILMDCQMPGLDGYDTTAAIRNMEKITGRHTPIVAMTANAMQGDREVCLAAGMDDYISKPIESDGLVDALRRWLKDGNGPLVEPTESLCSPALKECAQVESAVHVKDDPVDLPYLRRRFKENQVPSLLKIFTDTTADSLAKLKTAVASKDAGQLAFYAHKLKGSSMTIHAQLVGELSAKLEALGPQPDWAVGQDICQQLDTAVTELMEFLRKSSVLHGCE